jgi:Zn-dependent peptidase ImmA (M78 family)/DNA-binding XRE family transcriptional regulator
MFSPTRLTIARHRRAWSKSDLARRVSLSLRSISDYENGNAEPSPDSLERLAHVLSFPVDFFSAPEIEPIERDSASFRALSTMTAGQRNAALAAGTIAIEFAEWMDRRFVLPMPDLPEHAGQPETAARSIRQAWALGERPIRNLVHLLEQHGVRVFSLAELCREVDAFSVWRNGTPYVFLNTMKSPERSRLDAAHELGHLVLHRHAHAACSQRVGDDDEDVSSFHGREAEAEANAFASAFLMPRAALRATAPRMPTFDQLVQLKRTWRVSLAALAHRLHAIGAMNDWQYRSLCIEFSKKGYRTHEPHGLDERETSQVLAKVFAELRKKGTGRQDVARALRVQLSDLDELIFGLAVAGVDGAAESASTPRGHLRLV